jgi:hypothetical protein
VYIYQQQCREWLREYQRTPVEACTAVIVTHVASGTVYAGTSSVSQLYKPMNDMVIDSIIKQGEGNNHSNHAINASTLNAFINHLLHPTLTMMGGDG